MKLEDIRLWGTVDPDFVAAPGKDQCNFACCTLIPHHEGPHLDAHPVSGRIFGIWFNDGSDPVAPGDLSDEAVKIVMKLNRARDEAVEATEHVLGLKDELLKRYKDTDDSHIKAVFKASIWPRSEFDITHAGTEAELEEGIREELLDILVLNEEEEW